MHDKKRVWLFFAVLALFYLGANFAHPVTPTLIKERNFADYIFGVALASMMTANFLFSPFWGQLVDYISSRRIMLICSIGYAVGQALFGLAGSESMLLYARLFAGIFTGGVFTAFLTYLVNTSPPALRGNYLTIAATMQTVAGAFGYFVGGMLGEISVGVAITAQVITLAACGILFHVICVDDKSGAQEAINFKHLVRDANPIRAFLAGGRILTPLLVTLFAVFALSNLGHNAFDQSFNYYLKAQLGLTSGYNGTIKAVIGLVCLIANGTVGLWLINKTDMRRSSVLVHLACAAAILGVVFFTAMVPFIAMNILYFAFFAISVPLTQNMVATLAGDKDSNLVMGYFNGLKSLGGIFGALAAGFLYTMNAKLPFILGFFAFIAASAVAFSHYRLSLKFSVDREKGGRA